MPPSKYHRGRNLEWEVRKLFEDAGWDVLRGAGSKGEVAGFPTDLIASKSSPRNDKTIYIVLMQAKLKGKGET